MVPSTVRWALVCGARGGAKATMVQAVLDELRAAGLRVAGFQQVRATGDGHDLVRLATGERRPISRMPGPGKLQPGEELFCTRLFSMPLFQTARDWLVSDAAGADVWLLDEVSKLEAGKRGHHAALEWAFANAGGRPIVLGVRADQLFEVMSAVGLEHAPVASLEGEADEAQVKAFVRALSAR